jgi:hypothetical protein
LALAALIAACKTTDEPGGDALRATLPLVGRTLIEHQARQAARAGAGHVIILVERLPAALIAAIDRLRRSGISVEIARSVDDAADRVHPDEALLLIADGCIAGQGAIDRLAASKVPTLLTVPDEPGREGFERIDAGARWAGVALIDGARLRDTAAMLGDWDLESTLLRRAVQEGAARLSVFAAEERSGPAGLPIIAESPALLGAVETWLVGESRSWGQGWPARYIFRPLEGPAMRLLLGRVSEPYWLAAGAAGLALLAGALAAAGWFVPALVLLLLSGPLRAVGQRLAATRLSHVAGERLWDWLRAAGAGAALLAIGWRIAMDAGWGWWFIASLVILVMVALWVERRIAFVLAGRRPSPWLASTDALIWAFIPFALFGAWREGLGAALFYALLSFGLVQRGLWKYAADRDRGDQV